ncbi:[NiFe] hydrogenase metallocenter assembly protein HypE [Klebsiella pneumoniae]|uniref:[NiFe] hydrogenase metallocenter assembly protein HypE n=1 Tax=Klebsiella pneumoniae TaxID=573 RepID=A0A378FR52_KLEPN|nr:[NiFe] hydrogenase metallocenter assembly protein HypE [Klebsiella pneumoniae]
MSSPAASGCGIELQEATLPVNDTVRGVCELLGLDALNFANEGKLVLAVARDEAENVLAHLRSHALGRRCGDNRRSGRPPGRTFRWAVRREADARSSPRRTAAENLLTTASGPG